MSFLHRTTASGSLQVESTTSGRHSDRVETDKVGGEGGMGDGKSAKEGGTLVYSYRYTCWREPVDLDIARNL